MVTSYRPAVDASTVHGWLATLGATRILATRWPALTVHFDDGRPVLGGGPATEDEAIDAIRQATIDAIPPGGVLPDAPVDYPPPGRGWWRHPDQPPVWPPAVDGWPLTTPSGLLHPLLSPHAAQTVRGMIAAAGTAIAADPDLLLRALAGPGIGLAHGYPAGLWLTSSRRNGQDRPAMASPGRDWLALMAVPWMPAIDDPTGGTPDRPYRRAAPGWRWRQTGHGRHLVYEWRLWPRPVSAHAVPALIQAPGFVPSPAYRCGAHRPRQDRHDPPHLVDIPHAAVVDAGALDDVRLYSLAEVAQAARIRPATLRSYISRSQCPAPDAVSDYGDRCWTAPAIEPWLRRVRRPGARTDLTRT